MKRVFITGAALCAAGALVAGCRAHLESEVHHHQQVTATTIVTGSPAGYAAMDELPVTGGELRLVEAIEVEIELDLTAGGAREVAFPLRRTDVEADVVGHLAVFTVEQVFENPHPDPIEAVYLFPLGDEAAVVGYEIAIGERTVLGEIAPRDEARRRYQQAREQGHTAALLEQERANVFAQRIANIAPGETIRVRFQYVEQLAYADHRYELVFPMVVGPRYLPPGDRGARPIGAHRAGDAPQAASSVPYLEAERAGNDISFRARIDAGVPIEGVHSPTHDLDLQPVGDTQALVALAPHERLPNRDLVIRYDAAGPRTMVGLATHRDGDGAGYLSLLVQPKERYHTGDIVPREVIVLVDVSGSMDGQPLRQARALAKAVIDTLRPEDVFNIIAFASGTELMAEAPIAGNAGGRHAGVTFVEALRAGGGTEMERGVLESLARASGDRLRTIYLLSDGFVGNDDVILEAARRALGGSRIFPVGIGSSPNRFLIDRLAEIGRGAPLYLLPTEPADAVALDLVRRSAYPYLTEVAIDWGGLQVVDTTPELLRDIHAGTPLMVTARYLAPGRGTIRVTATTAGGPIAIPVEVELPARNARPAVRYAWARARVRDLESRPGRDAEVERAVTALGLEHGMVTEGTSFVAVDRTRVVESGGRVRTVEQPAAIPEGVNLEAAVAATAPAPDPVRSSSGGYRSGGGGGGGGGWGGGDMDPLTILLLLALVPGALALRRIRRA
jgi:Ca-activated chloride channel homolog